MAEFGNVYMTDTDGNIGGSIDIPSDGVSGLLFDISEQGGENFWTTGPGARIADKWKDTVIELNSLDDAIKAGITPFTGETETIVTGTAPNTTTTTVSKDIIAGIPYYHIAQYFRMAGGSGRLFVMFADCTQNWNALTQMQRSANGLISQFGVWTEQRCWSKADASDEVYSPNLVADLNNVAKSLADDYFSPVVIILNANTSKVKVGDNVSSEVVLSQLPDMTALSNRYVAHLLSQSASAEVRKMQATLDSTTPVGCVGLALAALTQMNVGQCIGWVSRGNVAEYVENIEFGFGDSALANNALTNSTRYASLTTQQLESLANKGYMFLRTYEGLEGSYFFTLDHTCCNGDYNTIARNRTINKSRRLVRTALLPYINSPVKVAAGSGTLTAATVTIFTNLITTALETMVSAEEISSIGNVTVPANQNILQTRTLRLSYSIVPLGCTECIHVTEGLTI